MIDDSLTIIIPTIGRPSIKQTLESIASQIGLFDQVFVIGDGHYPETKTIVDSYGIQYAYFALHDGPHKDWGTRARNFGIPLAKKAYIAFMDDDDRYLNGAFSAIRNAIHEHPGRAFMFKMKRGQNVLWRREELCLGNVSTQMAVFPNNQAKLGRFGDRYEGDFDFIRSTAALYGFEPFVWRSEIVAEVFRSNGK